jgi:membrane protein required for colicin V production
MEWVDWIILAVLVGCVLGGMAQGLFRTVCSLAGLILGIALAEWNYARFAVVFKPIVRIDAVANAIAFLLIAVVVMFLANVAGIALSKMLNWMGLGCIDILGGAIVGFVQGVLLVTVCILVTVAFFPQTQWLTQAEFPQMFFGALHVSTNTSPSELSGRVMDGLKTLKHDAPKWMNEKNGGS